MKATGFERPAAALFAAVSLAAIIAAFAIGQARAQTVNPVPPPPPPTFNPSTPNTAPQAPYTPVAPPSGLGSTPVPATPDIVAPSPAPPPPAPPPPVPPSAAPPPPAPPQTANPPAAAEPAPPPAPARHHERARHKRHARFPAARALGPSYDPGLGEFYSSQANPCHFRQVWSGYYAGYWATYTCSW